MVGSEVRRLDGLVRDVQASSAGGWRGGCARKVVLVQAAQQASGGGSQQLTYLDVVGEYGLLLTVVVGRREEVMGWEIGCDHQYRYCQTHSQGQ